MKKQLLKIIPCMGLLFGLSAAQAQTANIQEEQGLNLVKFNVMSLLGGKISIEYERMLTDRISAGAAVSIRPKNGLPFGSSVKSIVDDEELDNVINNFSSSNFSITPEARFYTSKRGPFKGFYVAPYVKYASYGASVPFEFDVEAAENERRTETIPLKGNISSFTAGVSFGVNFRLARNIHLDWRILGPGYGSAKGKVAGKMALDTEEQAELRSSLADLKTDLADFALPIKIDYDVNSEGANVKNIKKSMGGNTQRTIYRLSFLKDAGTNTTHT